MKQPTKAKLREELEQLRDLANRMKQLLSEAVTLNISSGKVISLLVDFDLGHDEKLGIVELFTHVRTINEANELYTKVKEELKNKIVKQIDKKYETLLNT